MYFLSCCAVNHLKCLGKPVALNESVNNCREAAAVNELILLITPAKLTASALLSASSSGAAPNEGCAMANSCAGSAASLNKFLL